MATDAGVVAMFVSPAVAASAIRALRERGIDDIRAQTAAPYPEIEEAIGRKRSRLGIITLIGALTGMLCGIAFTVGTSLNLPLMVGGKPIVSMPAFLPIIFECTVLIGCLTNFTAVVLGSFLARRARPVPWDDRASVDRILVYVPGKAKGKEDLPKLLRSLGAEEVRP
jgi:hypothetical protein